MYIPDKWELDNQPLYSIMHALIMPTILLPMEHNHHHLHNYGASFLAEDLDDVLLYHSIRLRHRQNCCYFADGIFLFILFNQNNCNPMQILLNFFSSGQINQKLAFLQTMMWWLRGHRLLSKENKEVDYWLIYVTPDWCSMLPYGIEELGHQWLV